MRKLNPTTLSKEPLDNYSKMNDKLDNIIDIMENMLYELKMLNNYNTDKIKSQSLFIPFNTSR